MLSMDGVAPCGQYFDLNCCVQTYGVGERLWLLDLGGAPRCDVMRRCEKHTVAEAVLYTQIATISALRMFLQFQPLPFTSCFGACN